MFGYEIAFERPAYLALLALLPLTWFLARRSYAAMSRTRWALALLLRSGLVLLIVAALAEIHVVRTSERTSTIYLVDRSLSIPNSRIGDAIRYVNESTEKHRRIDLGDAIGVISFGRDAAVEIVPWDAAPYLPSQFVGDVDPEQTDLAAALKLARSMFPGDAARRIVILSDGNETLGDAATVAREMAVDGIGIDTVAIRRADRPEVGVVGVVAPSDVRRGATFELRTVLEVEPDPAHAGEPVAGRLSIVRKSRGVERLIAEKPVELEPGKNVLAIQETIEDSGFHQYEARFVPHDAKDDSFAQNNVATGFADVSGPGRALLIVDQSRPHEFDGLAALLREESIEVEIQPSNQLFADLSELLSYDVVLLANVPRTGGEDVDSLTQFTDAQIQALVDNVEQMGCGLGMIGGPDSFGAGGWIGTDLEKAMPVDFKIPNDKVLAVGALALVIDSSGSMQGQKVQLCKAAAREAAKSLGPRDYVSVTSFDVVAHRIVPMQRAENKAKIERLIGTLGADGGTNMYPAMVQAYMDLKKSPAAVKHMIVLTDGQTQEGAYYDLTRQIAGDGITVTAVAVGSDADVTLLQGIANEGRGKFYRVSSPLAIPRIFLREARRVSKPLVFEDPNGFQPRLVRFHEALVGINDPLPPLTGYVLTEPKTNPLVEIPIVSPVPSGTPRPILASWRYGIGRTFVLSTDTGQRWANAWENWEGRDKLLVQMVRWAMRAKGNDGFAATATVEDDRVRLVLTALDQSDAFVNALSPTVVAIGPDGETIDAELTQEAPGRYVGEFRAPKPGSYLAAISTKAGEAPVRVGVDVGYSQEFRTRDANLARLEQLAALVPAGGEAGVALDLPEDGFDEAFAADPFRRTLRPARSSEDAWYLALAFAAALLAFDAANRRIEWRPGWIILPFEALRDRLRQRQGETEPAAALERLAARKEAIRQEQHERTAANRRHDAESVPVHAITVKAVPGGANEEERKSEGSSIAPSEKPADYADRLRAAKRHATASRKNSDSSGDR